MTPMIKRKIASWASVYIDSPEVIKAAQVQAKSQVLRSVESKQYKLDPDRPMEIKYTDQHCDFLLDDKTGVVLAEVGVLMTPRQDNEWLLEREMSSLVDINDAIRRAEEIDHDKSDDEWIDDHEALIFQRVESERRIVKLREKLGWT